MNKEERDEQKEEQKSEGDENYEAVDQIEGSMLDVISEQLSGQIISFDEFEKFLPKIADWFYNIFGEDYKRKLRVLKLDRDELRFNIALFTAHYSYHISVKPGTGSSSSYMGCIKILRYALPGEISNRGKDMPDGKLNEETFNKILFSILNSETNVLSESILNDLN